MMMMQGKRLVLLTFVLTLLSNSSCFVVVPPSRTKQNAAVADETLLTTLLERPSQDFDSGESSKPRTNILKRIANSITSWIRPASPQVDVFDEDEAAVDSELILSPKQRNELITKEMNDAWPIRTMEESVTRSISRELAQEQRKAKPLLKDAQRSIRKDKELKDVLGEPIHIRPIFSGSSSTTIFNGKKTERIVDTFEVVGSRKSGTAKFVADKYAKGHIQTLRVDVEGIHYDIDV